MRFFCAFFIVLGLMGWRVGMSGKAHEIRPSLRDKIGQMLIVGFEDKEVTSNSTIAKDIKAYNLGGVILFDYNYQKKSFDKNIESPAQVKTLNSSLQSISANAQLKRRRELLPLLISIDYEGGNVNRLKEHYGFPKTYPAVEVGRMSTSATHDIADTMAATLKDAGFNLDFAPVLDVNVNPDNPVLGQLGRTFSDDPMRVSEYAKIFAQHFSQHNIACVYKHFPGHGSSTTDSHLGFVDVSQTWKSYELMPYQVLLNEPETCEVIMTAHIINRQLDATGLPATLSHSILTDLLRTNLGFQGVIISDDMQMKAISQHYGLEEALTLAINAGVDMFIFGNQLTETPQNIKQVIDIIEAKVKSGEISQARIDNAYQHIRTLKKKLAH